MSLFVVNVIRATDEAVPKAVRQDSDAAGDIQSRIIKIAIIRQQYKNKPAIPKCNDRLESSISGNGNAIVKIYILYRLEHFNTIFKRTLKRLSAKNKTHPSCSFINYRCFYCFL